MSVERKEAFRNLLRVESSSWLRAYLSHGPENKDLGFSGCTTEEWQALVEGVIDEKMREGGLNSGVPASQAARALASIEEVSGKLLTLEELIRYIRNRLDQVKQVLS